VSRRVRADHGGATILVVAMAGVLMFVTVGLAAVGGLVIAQRRAQAAADLAALGAASVLDRACQEADGIAAANTAVLDGCQVDGDEVRVTVSVGTVSAFWREVRVSAEARAGPA
jgi:secretion/DNA translocation related TadE-like protein